MTEQTNSPKQLAQRIFRRIKLKKLNDVGQDKILGLYEEFILSYLGLVFFIKPTGLFERDGINHIIGTLPEGTINAIMTPPTTDKIKELSKERVKNLHPRKKHNGVYHEPYEEADALQTAIDGNDKKDILIKALLVVYVIRCNLFHGDKNWTVDNDNRKIGIATPFLTFVLSKLVE